MEFVERRRSAPPNASVRLIAAGVVFGFCYWASTVLITLVVSILFAYLLDPLVELLERVRVPRAVGSLATVLVALALVGVLIWGVADRADQFAQSWPEYSAVLKRATGAVQERLQKIETMFAEIAGQEKRPRTPEVQLRGTNDTSAPPFSPVFRSPPCPSPAGSFARRGRPTTPATRRSPHPRGSCSFD